MRFGRKYSVTLCFEFRLDIWSYSNYLEIIKQQYAKTSQKYSLFSLSLPLKLYFTTALKHSIFLPPKLLITLWILSAVRHGSLGMVHPPSGKPFLILTFSHQSYVGISIFHDSENLPVDLSPTDMFVFLSFHNLLIWTFEISEGSCMVIKSNKSLLANHHLLII